jgi:hypothetical protein
MCGVGVLPSARLGRVVHDPSCRAGIKAEVKWEAERDTDNDSKGIWIHWIGLDLWT